MDSVQSDAKLLSVLNDDCIYKILEWLPFDDLCLVSRTCRHLQLLCDNHFRRKCQEEANGEVNICLLNDDGSLRYANYVKFFNNFIKKMRIITLDVTYSRNVATFIKKKCDPDLHHIIIDGDLNMNIFCEEMESFLRNVEIVQFTYVYPEYESTSLEDHTNLKTLSLENLCQKNVDTIFGQKYPKLRHFHWRDNSFDQVETLKADKLKVFLQNNEHIQCIELNYAIYTSSDRLMINVFMDCITTIIGSALKLEHLSLFVDQKIMDPVRFRKFCVNLKVLCDRDYFKSLDLQFGGGIETIDLFKSHAIQMANFKQLKKITMSADGLFKFVNVLSPFIHLKSIVLDRMYYADRDRQWPWSTIDELVFLVDKKPIIALPQIEDLTFVRLDDGKQTLTFLMQIARHWVNLKKISFTQRPRNNFPVFDGSFPVDKLNKAREKLKNACEITIFLDNVNYSAANVERKLVKLKYVKFDERWLHHSQHCMLKN